MKTVYIEKNIRNHPRVENVLARLNPPQIIICEQYQEVFNPKSQNFRIQKKHPALILAEKMGTRVLPSPPNFGIGGQQNYYFSHMLNCLYDCRYCFLQGMYSSANYVWFVNYEDYMQDIRDKSSDTTETIYFFSGYDCDSLAFEPVTGFVKAFLPFFYGLQNAVLELRTKSTNVQELLNHPSFPHCIIAFSFTPEEISREVEHKVPAVAKRIAAIQRLVNHGWQIGLRFDPLIYHPQFKEIYTRLLTQIFSVVSQESLHSISIGPMRFPEKMYQKIIKLYPKDPLLSHPLYRKGKIFSYRTEVEQAMKNCLQQLLQNYVPKTILFECYT